MSRNILSSVLLSLLLVTSAFAGYVDNNNGTVSDTTTNLVWQKQDDGIAKIWENAISYCEGLTLSGFTDWRLPNIKELNSLVDDSRYNPTIDPLFAGMTATIYWSSTTVAGYATNAWYVNFGNGYTSNLGGPYGNKTTDTYYVRCVRGQ